MAIIPVGSKLSEERLAGSPTIPGTAQDTTLRTSTDSPGVYAPATVLPPIDETPYAGNAIAAPAGSQWSAQKPPGFSNPGKTPAGTLPVIVSPPSIYPVNTMPITSSPAIMSSTPVNGKEGERPAPSTGTVQNGMGPGAKPAAGMIAGAMTGNNGGESGFGQYLPYLAIGAVAFFLLRTYSK